MPTFVSDYRREMEALSPAEVLERFVAATAQQLREYRLAEIGWSVFCHHFGWSVDAGPEIAVGLVEGILGPWLEDRGLSVQAILFEMKADQRRDWPNPDRSYHGLIVLEPARAHGWRKPRRWER